MKNLSLFLALCFFFPLPVFALRAGIEGTVPAGMEERLRPGGAPAVEVLHPDRLVSFRLRKALWAFDGPLWSGYPSKEADRYFAQRLGLDTRNPAVMKSFHDFIQAASGLSWEEVKGRLQARGWALAEEIAGEGLLADVRNYADEVVAREKRTDPAKYLVPGSRDLLSALKEAGVRQIIVTGASAQSRAKYAMQLGIRLFFDEIHGEGKKEEVVAHELAEKEPGPDGIALIGDGLRDMEIGRRAGILAVAYAATPEARAAFLALPEKFRPDVILNGDYHEVEWILSVLGVPDPGRNARLREYEHMFLEDLESPVILTREYTVYITELVQRKPPPGKERWHHVGAMVSLSPFEPPIGFLPFANIFKDEKGSAPWITEKIELLRRLMEERHPIEVAVDRKGMSYKPGRHLDFVFRLVEPWSRARVLRFRHSTDRLTEPMFLNALARGIPIPVAVRNGVSKPNLEGMQVEVIETVAQLLRQTPVFSGNPGAGPFKIQVEERQGHVVPRLLLLENGAVSSPQPEQPVSLDRIITKALWEFSELAAASKNTYEGQITLRMEQLDQFLILELMDNGSGLRTEDLGQFFYDLLGSKPLEWLTTYGSEMVRRHGGWIEVDTRPGKTDAFRATFDPTRPDVELSTLRPGVRLGHGTTVRWVFNLDSAARGYFTAAGTEEKLPTYPALLRRYPEEKEFKLPDMIWPRQARFIRLPRKGVFLPWGSRGYPELWKGIRVVNQQRQEEYLHLSMPENWRPPQVQLRVERGAGARSYISLGGDSAAGDRYALNGILVKVIPKLGVLVRPYKTRDPIYIERIETATPLLMTSPEEDLVRSLGDLIVEQERQRLGGKEFVKEQWLLREPDKSIELYRDRRGFKILRSRLDKEWIAGTPPHALTAAFPQGTWSLRALQELVPDILLRQRKHWLPGYSDPIRVAGSELFRVMIDDFGHTGSLYLQLESYSVEEMEAKAEPLMALIGKIMIPVPEPLDSLLDYLKHLSSSEGRWALKLQTETVLSLFGRAYAGPAERERAWAGLASFLANPKHPGERERGSKARTAAVEALVNLSWDPRRIRLAIPILETLADPNQGEEEAVQKASQWGTGALSGRMAPRWFELDALSPYYGMEVQEQVNRLAREVKADVAMLLPLNSREEDILRVHPYFLGGEATREQTRRYFEEANQQLASYGMAFAPLQNPPEPDRFERMGLLVHEGELPKGAAPEGYRALSADRVDPGNPDRYEPVLVASSAIYPMLSLESLRVRVKLAVVVQDTVTGARYLAVLA